jgi:hypothetical protein
MGKTKGPYVLEFPVGSLVKVKGREVLDEFARTWRYHNKLQPDQLDFAGAIGKVNNFGFYFGGDEIYQLDGIPGTWHEECLEPAHDVSPTIGNLGPLDD